MWELLEKADLFISLGTFLITLIIAISGRHFYRVRFWLHDVKSKHAKSEAIILFVHRKQTAIDTLEEYIDKDDGDGGLKFVQKNARVYVEIPNEYTPGDVDKIVAEVKRRCALARKAARSNEIYAFMDTTVVLGSIICTSCFAQRPVYLHQLSKDRTTYEPWGLLRRGT